MKNKNIIFLFISVFIFLISCRKYEENPLISLRTKNSRLIGNWELQESEIQQSCITDSRNIVATINAKFDGDSLTIISDSIIKKFAFEMNLNFNEDLVILERTEIEFEYFQYQRIPVSTSRIEISTNSWEWYDGTSHKEIIYMDKLLFDLYSQQFFYKIVKLTNKELILECNSETRFEYYKARYRFRKKK